MAKHSVLARKLGSLLSREARRLGMSASEVARATGLSQPTVSRIFAGRTAADLGAILLILGVLAKTLTWLDMSGIKAPRAVWRCVACGTDWMVGTGQCIACCGKRQELRVGAWDLL